MAKTKKTQDDEQHDPNIVHIMPKTGETLTYERDKTYGDRATLQVPRGELDRVEGVWTEVDPAKVPDVAKI